MIPLFFLELLILFFSAKQVINSVFSLFFAITRSKKTAIYLLAILFFPGTFIHEFAHLFMAVLLRVPTGALDLFPRLEEKARLDSSARQGVTMGSVEIAKTDSIRRFLIGVAPLLVGLGIIFGILWHIELGLENKWLLVLVGYILFVIANTMFSSKRDMEGMVPLIVAAVVVTGLLYGMGFRVPTQIADYLNIVAGVGVRLLVVSIGINALFLALTLLKRR